MNQIKICERKEHIFLGTGSVVSILQHPTQINCLIVANSTGHIFYLNSDSFQILHNFRAFYQYCLCAIIFQDSICTGNSSGQLTLIKLSGDVLWRKKLHSDCLSGISESQDYLITVSHDCYIKFFSKTNVEVEKVINLQSPIWSVIYFQNTIFTSGNQSYSISLNSFTPKSIKRFDQFAIFNKKLYACSDERGFTCLTSNSNSYIPCNFILPLRNCMMIFSEECIGQITHTGSMQWKCHRIKQIKPGTAITSGCANKKSMILGDLEGFVYKIDLEEEIKGDYNGESQ